MSPPLRSIRTFFLLITAIIGMAVGASPALGASPAIVSRAPGYLEIFKRNPTTGNINFISWNYQTGWGAWQDMGGPVHPGTDIAVLSRGVNHLSVYVRSSHDSLIQRYWDGGSGWSGWQEHGGVLRGGPTAVAWDSQREDVFVTDTGNSLAQKTWTAGGGWGGWVGLGGGLMPNSGPSASSRAPGYVDVAVTGTDRRLYIKSFRPDTGWFPYYAVEGWLAGGPGVASQRGDWNGRQDYTGVSSTGEVVLYTYANGGFNGWHGLGGQVTANRAPKPIWWSDGPGKAQRFDVATYGTGDSGTVHVRTWLPESGWTGWWAVPNSDPPPPPPPPPPSLIPSGQSCRSTQMSLGSSLGISLGWRPSRITNPSGADQATESRIYDQMVSCLHQIGGSKPGLRMQFPIDGLRSKPGGRGSMEDELTKFRDLLNRGNVAGEPVISIMSHNFDACTSVTRRTLQGVGALPEGEALGPCTYPDPPLYRHLFGQVKQRVEQILGRTDVKFTVWNEPDKRTFTLAAAGGANYGARLAGELYAKVLESPALISPDRLLAGEFTEENVTNSNSNIVTLDSLRRNFLEGAGRTWAQAWALHAYGDMTNAASTSLFPSHNGFQGLPGVTGSPIYATEVGTRLADTGVTFGPNSNKAVQWGYGDALRRQLGGAPTRAYLYHLSAPSSGWDSGFADRSGRARPSLCGLAQIPVASCLGNQNAYGG